MKHLIALLLIFSFQAKATWKQERDEMTKLNREAINILAKAKISLEKAEATTDMEKKVEFAIEARQLTKIAIKNTKKVAQKAHNASTKANDDFKHASVQMQQLLQIKTEATDIESKMAAEEALKENGVILRENRNFLHAIHKARTKIKEIREQVQVILVQTQSIFLQAKAAGWTQKINEIIRFNQQAITAIGRAKIYLERAEATTDMEKKTAFAIRARRSAHTAIRNTEKASQEAEKTNFREVSTSYRRPQMKQSSEIRIGSNDLKSRIPMEETIPRENNSIPKKNRSFSNTIHDVRRRIRQTGEQAQAVLQQTHSACSEALAPHEKTATLN